MVCDVIQSSTSNGVMDEQFMGVSEPMFDGAANDACSDDADLHRPRESASRQKAALRIILHLMGEGLVN